MDRSGARPIQVIAMHGWAGDSRCWKPWIEATENCGWHWQCGERGYGAIEPRRPAWPARSGAPRMVVGHSLGPHLLAPEVLQCADFVVLLASFAAFVPPDRSARRVRAALQGMETRLGSQEEAAQMLEKFLANAAFPEPAEQLPPGPCGGPLNLERLRADLGILGDCRGLSTRLPPNARVLLVEAGQDRIVEPAARAMLREEFPAADFVRLPRAGHALLRTDVISRAVEWASSQS